MNKRIPSLLAILALFVVTMPFRAALPAQAAESPAGSEILGSVDDLTITAKEVQEAAAEALDRVELKRIQYEAEIRLNRHQALEQALGQLIREKLVEKAAAAAGQEIEAFRAAEMARIRSSITDEEVATWFEANKSRLRGNPTLEELAPRIKSEVLEPQKVNDFYAQLESEADVQNLLPPYRVDVEAGEAPAHGPSDAPVTIVEFSDFQCPYCQKIAPTLKRVTESYGSQVRLAFKHYPLANHPNAQKAAEASMCAAEQGKFWEMHDLLFAEQRDLEVDSLREKAVRLGLEAESFNACLDSDRFSDQVAQDFRAGVEAGVTGTPAVYVNGMPLPGLRTFEALAEVIDAELDRLGVSRDTPDAE